MLIFIEFISKILIFREWHSSCNDTGGNLPQSSLRYESSAIKDKNFRFPAMFLVCRWGSLKSS